MVIALCGKSGSGKSIMSSALADLGAYVIDADKIGKEIICGDVLDKIKKEFPDCITDGHLDRHNLAEKVFSDSEALSILNSITHPAIKRKIIEDIRSNSEKYEYIIIDAAVLIEAGMADTADFTVAVVAPDSLRKKRIISRDNIKESMADSRLSSQMTDDFYKKNTDYYVVNDGSVSINKLAENILERSRVFAENKCCF